MPTSMESFVVSLYECLNDKDDIVRDAVASSLHVIGTNEPIMLLTSAHAFLSSRHKLANAHRAAMLNVLRKICAETLNTVPDNLAALVINLATQELTFSKESIEDWQSAASSLLTVLCRKHCGLVVESLLQKFQPGMTPHPYVLHTLGDVSITNASEFIPFLTDILSRTVPMIGSIKHEPTRYAVASAAKKFCESVLEYSANIQRSEQPKSFSKDSFYTQFSALYDVFYSSWLQSKDIRTRGAVIECLGELCHMLPLDKMREESKRLLPHMIQQLKKLPDPLPAISGMCRLLEAVVSDQQPVALDSQVDDLWVALFTHVAVDPDRVDNQLARCQNEALRCYHVTATRYSDKLVYYLIQKLQSVNEKTRICALIIMRYLVNSAGVYIEDKKSLIIMALKPAALHDSSNKVKKWLCHLTLALGDHGYLDVENGHLLVDFIVKQIATAEEASLDKKQTDSDYAANKVLRLQCSQALFSMASNVRSTESVLWPFLFEYLCAEQYTLTLSDLFRSLVPLAHRLNAENRLNIVYAGGNDRLPGPHQILARLLVCAGVAETRQKRGLHAVQLMKEMARFFFPALQSRWDYEIVNLLNLWEDSSKEKSDKWEQAILKFISMTVDTVNDEEWSCALAAALGKQLTLYSAYIAEKSFLFKSLGVVLAKIKNLQFVVDHLDLIFRHIDHANALERAGCAQGIGFCAASHVDIVLTKLENVAKLEYQKKSTGLLGFIKDSIPMKTENDAEIANIKATVMLAYGYVAFHCPLKIVVQKMESIILRFLAPYFQNSKDTVVRQSLLCTADLLTMTVHPRHLLQDYRASFGLELLNNIKEYVKAEPADFMSTNIRILAIRAVKSLAQLEQAVADTELWTAVTLFANYVYSIQSVKCEPGDEDEVSMENLILTFHSLLTVVILKHSPAERLTAALKILQPWFSSDSAIERERSIDSACYLLKIYYTSADIVLGHATEFHLMGSLLGRFCPRFCDCIPVIRQTALDCVHWLLAISLAHMGHGKDYHDTIVDSILEHKESLQKTESNCHLGVVVQLAKVIDQRLPGKQIQNYLTVLFDLVLDKQLHVSTAAATLLKLQFITKGEQLISEAEKIICVLQLRLSSIPSGNVQTYAECLLALHEFSKHHLHLTINALLLQQLPFSQSVCDCWASLSRDHQLLPLILDYLLEILTHEPAFDPPAESSGGQKVARTLPLTATNALTIVCLHLPESSHQQWFPRLLVRLLVQSGAFADTLLPRGSQVTLEFCRQNSPASVVREAVKSLLARHPVFLTIDDRTWSDFDDPSHYSDAVSSVSKSLGANNPELIEPVVHLLKESQQSKVDGARVVCASVFSSFVKYCQQQSDELIEMLITTLMAGLADTSLCVRKISVRGMGYVTHCSDAIFEKYSQTVTSAMMAGLEDPTDHKDEVALEAMQGLGRLTTRISKAHIEKMMVYVMLRIRPCFEKSSGAVRAVAFSLFGNLARFECTELYVEQIHSNIVSLLLHLNDEVEEVRTACAFVTGSISIYMNKTDNEAESYRKLVSLSGTSNFAGFLPTAYHQFLKEATKFLVDFYPDRLNFYALCCANYLKSSSMKIRSNAALFIGYLLGNVPQDQRTTISKDLIFTGLALLLKEPEPEVRQAAAESAAYLHGY